MDMEVGSWLRYQYPSIHRFLGSSIPRFSFFFTPIDNQEKQKQK